MFITVINDCRSQNDIGRQTTRLTSLFAAPVNFIGVNSNLGDTATIEAAGNLIDILDAGEGKEGLIIVNVAPRGEIKKKWENGSPFCYFWYRKTLVVSTIEGYVLSLVKKLKICDRINLVDVKQVTSQAVEHQYLEKKQADHINNTQFRSYEFAPRLADWLLKGETFSCEPLDFAKIHNIPQCIWYIDTFGNAKTTILPSELLIDHGKVITDLGEFRYFNRLKNIPKNCMGIYPGSSGIGTARFVELSLQQGKINEQLSLQIGQLIRQMPSSVCSSVEEKYVIGTVMKTAAFAG